MPNPFQQMQMQQMMQQQAQNNPQFNSIKQAYNMFQNGNMNPMQVLNNMAMQNPQFKPFVQMLQNGANPEIVFKQMCQQRGIDPNQFIQMLTQK